MNESKLVYCLDSKNTLSHVKSTYIIFQCSTKNKNLSHLVTSSEKVSYFISIWNPLGEGGARNGCSAVNLDSYVVEQKTYGHQVTSGEELHDEI